MTIQIGYGEAPTREFAIYAFATFIQEPGSTKRLITGKVLKTLGPVENHYGRDGKVIPKDTILVADFGCDSGLYAMAAIGGGLEKVLIPLNEWVWLDWSDHEETIRQFMAPGVE